MIRVPSAICQVALLGDFICLRHSHHSFPCSIYQFQDLSLIIRLNTINITSRSRRKAGPFPPMAPKFRLPNTFTSSAAVSLFHRHHAVVQGCMGSRFHQTITDPSLGLYGLSNATHQERYRKPGTILDYFSHLAALCSSHNHAYKS